MKYISRTEIKNILFWCKYCNAYNDYFSQRE